MAQLLFGTAGVPHSAEPKSTLGGIERVAALGLGCMEIEFAHQVRIGEDTARQVAETARRTGTRLTVHAPYYINLNAREPDKVIASQTRLLKAARAGALCGAVSVAFHAAFYLGDPPETVDPVVRRRIAEVREELAAEGNRLWIRPEMMGRATQFGDLPELLDLAAEVDLVAPCLDFAHWHARTGEHNSYDEFSEALGGAAERLLAKLGMTPRFPAVQLGALLAAVANGIGLQLSTGGDPGTLENSYAVAWLGVLQMSDVEKPQRRRRRR